MIRWLFLFSLLSTHLYSQNILEGSVIDKQTRAPIPYASIGILGTHKGTSSNYDGQFSFAVDEPCQIKISCVGYESRTFHTSEFQSVIELNPIVTELRELYVYNKKVNPYKIVRKAFASIYRNYSTQSFMQKYFYRHYCKDDSVYGRLIEASVDVWKHNGYKPVRHTAGDQESIRITQLRRSLDKTIIAQGHTPISVGNILQADILAYQTLEKSEHLKFYDEASNLKTDFDDYLFTFDGNTTYDGQEVYKINYSYRPDSILTTSGYEEAPGASGTLFITTDTYAVIKTEDVRHDRLNSISSKTWYSKVENRYYPYHFVREGESRFPANGAHTFRIEMISIETRLGDEDKFIGSLPEKEDLLKIPYDSSFWNKTTKLKATPLEDKIISDLGGGRSLEAQFLRYQQYEWSTNNGGVDAEKKLSWLLQDSQGERILYIAFWNSNVRSCVPELEQVKKLNKIFRGRITFILVAMEDDETRWRQLIDKYNLFSEGILNYRIGTASDILKAFSISDFPSFCLVNKIGDITRAKPASDPQNEKEFINLLNKK